jgi:tRNA threonylcarbamoyladenosine biosynthesis protein TsaE
MNQFEFLSKSADHTLALGRELARMLRPPSLLLLFGELGAGKTTLAKGIISGLGVAREEEIASPTFTLVHVFQNSIHVYHVDLYRIAGFQELESLGLEDCFEESSIVIVEWAERLRFRTGSRIVRIQLEHASESARRIRIQDENEVLDNLGALNI